MNRDLNTQRERERPGRQVEVQSENLHPMVRDSFD